MVVYERKEDGHDLFPLKIMTYGQGFTKFFMLVWIPSGGTHLEHTKIICKINLGSDLNDHSVLFLKTLDTHSSLSHLHLYFCGLWWPSVSMSPTAQLEVTTSRCGPSVTKPCMCGSSCLASTLINTFLTIHSGVKTCRHVHDGARVYIQQSNTISCQLRCGCTGKHATLTQTFQLQRLLVNNVVH